MSRSAEPSGGSPIDDLGGLDDRERALLSSWNDMHKKSQVIFLVLSSLVERDRATDEVAAFVDEISDGHLSVDPKSLYRTLARLVDNGLLGYDEVPVPRSGVRRKVYGLTESGSRVLGAYRATTLAYLDRL